MPKSKKPRKRARKNIPKIKARTTTVPFRWPDTEYTRDLVNAERNLLKVHTSEKPIKGHPAVLTMKLKPLPAPLRRQMRELSRTCGPVDQWPKASRDRARRTLIKGMASPTARRRKTTSPLYFGDDLL